MKEFISDFLNLLYKSFLAIVLILVSYQLVGNFYHYRQVTYKYNYDINEDKKIKTYKEKVDYITNKTNEINEYLETNPNRRMMVFEIKREFTACNEKLSKTDFYNLNKETFSYKDVYDLNNQLPPRICLIDLANKINKYIDTYQSANTNFSNTYDVVKTTGEHLLVSSNTIYERLLGNGSYYYYNPLSRNTLYDDLEDDLFLTISNYNLYITSYEQLFEWFMNEIGGVY